MGGVGGFPLSPRPELSEPDRLRSTQRGCWGVDGRLVISRFSLKRSSNNTDIVMNKWLEAGVSSFKALLYDMLGNVYSCRNGKALIQSGWCL